MFFPTQSSPRLFGPSLASILLAYCLAESAAAGATTVAIDVGHSLRRPGATSARGVSEFRFNKALAAALKDELEANGIGVRVIGEEGDADDLRKRAAMARGADLLLSIHHDSTQPRYLKAWRFGGKRYRMTDQYSGFSLFVSRANPRLETSRRYASAIGGELRAIGLRPSTHHAEKIRGENRPFADESNGVHYFDELIVLKTAPVPAVLFEAGIIVNPADERMLADPETKKRIAAALTRAIKSLSGEESPPARAAPAHPPPAESATPTF